MLLFQMMVTGKNPYESISTGLDTGFIGRRLLYFPQLSSTMDTAREEVRMGAEEGTVIIAGEQTGGRGRNRRHWLTPPGNIALSIILYPDTASLPYLVMIAALAVVRSIGTVIAMKADIKWPNDVLIGGKKACGILIENEIRGAKSVGAVIGIGINVNLGRVVIGKNSLPVTSLEREVKQSISKGDLVKNIFTEMERLYRRLPDGGSIFREWRDNLATLGKKVTVETNEGILEGIAESVDESGSLKLKLDDGGCTSIVAGDVMLRQK